MINFCIINRVEESEARKRCAFQDYQGYSYLFILINRKIPSIQGKEFVEETYCVIIKFHSSSPYSSIHNYNEESEELKKLLNTYLDTTYNSYDNKYNYIDFKDLEEYLKGKINLSYSSMNNYYLCAFRFYIENVLKLDPFTDTFAAFLGNLFHDCLSKMYEDGFDLKSNYEAYLSKKELNAKEKFFCEKLYTNLEFIIRTIRFQEGYSKYNKVLTEKHISVDKSSKLKINFLGFVDKIKYLEEDSGRWLVAIIDYKTGSVETTLDNINYGLHLQLPVYIYLTKNGLHKNIKITGFYLQKILNNSSVDCDDVLEDLRKKLKLDGFTIDDEDLIKTIKYSIIKKYMGM